MTTNNVDNRLWKVKNVVTPLAKLLIESEKQPEEGTAVINLINNSFMAYLPLGHSALKVGCLAWTDFLTKMATEEELNKVSEDIFCFSLIR